jgi:hypothetical protein
MKRIRWAALAVVLALPAVGWAGTKLAVAAHCSLPCGDHCPFPCPDCPFKK